MSIVSDAAPLIFLSKVKQLPLLGCLFRGRIYVPLAVKKELLAPGIPPDEERTLQAFLAEQCHLVTVRKPMVFANALSLADNCVLTVARRRRVSLVLSDDRLLRKIALIEGFGVVGTIGVLIKAAKGGLLTGGQAISTLDELVQKHGFRISTAVYSRARSVLAVDNFSVQ